MSTDFSIRPVGASVVTPAVVQQVPDAAKSAVPTQLNSDKAVIATANVQTNSSDPRANANLGHQIMIDRAAAEVVYQVVDNRTNLVVNQYPDETRLRARAYLRAQDEAKEEKKTQRHADRQA
jgi:DNA primase large subunit